MKVLMPTAFAILGAFSLVACSPKKEPTKPNKPTVAAASPKADIASPAPVTAVPQIAPQASATLPTIGPAPKWELLDVNGKRISSDEFKGKVVVLDFWATWCPPCRSEMPGYTDLQRKYGKDRLAIIGVSLDDAGPAVVKQFIE